MRSTVTRLISDSCLDRPSDGSSDDSDADGSDAFVVTLGQPSTEKPLSGNDKGKQKLGNETAMRLRSLGSRHVLVKDTAFQT